MEKPILNTFDGGLYLDAHWTTQPPNTWNYALNVVNRDFYQKNYISNEHSNYKAVEYDHQIVGARYINSLNSTLYILINGEFHLYNHDKRTSQFVASDTEFGCIWGFKECRWVDPEIQVVENGEHIVRWSFNKIYYKLNLQEMLDPERKQAIKDQVNSDCGSCNKNACEYFKVFKSNCGGTIKLSSNSKGGSLPAGAYYATYRMLTNTGSYSNYSTIEGPVFISSQYNISGQQSNGSIDVRIDSLSCDYDRLEIIIISVVNGVITARSILDTGYSNNHYVYTYSGLSGVPIDIAEVLVRTRTYLEGEYQIQYNNRMHYYGIKQDRNFNYQPYANNIVIKALEIKVPYDVAKQHNLRSFMRNETYAFGIRLNKVDKQSTPYFHIPCTPSGGSVSNNNLNIGGILNVDTISGLKLLPTTSSSSGGGTNIEIEEGSSSVQAFGNYTIEDSREYKRHRDPIEGTVGNPQQDDFLENHLIPGTDAFDTYVDDVITIIRPVCSDESGTYINPCDGSPSGGLCPDCCPVIVDELGNYCNVKNAHKDADIIDKDIRSVEKFGVKWFSVLGDYISDGNKKDLVKLFSPSTFKESAQQILGYIKKRERYDIKTRKIKVDKSASYDSSPAPRVKINAGKKKNIQTLGPKTNNEGSTLDKVYVLSDNGIISLLDGQYEILRKIDLNCDSEKDLTYPCTKDCDGNNIYGALAGEPIKHHKFPNCSESVHFQSGSIGVPSKITPDASEYSDGYCILLALYVENIVIPTNEELGFKLCEQNPATIGMVKTTSANRKVTLKGIAFPNYVSTNQGKQYVYQRHANSSIETVNKYIDIDGKRLDSGASPHNSCAVYSLDGNCAEPALLGERLIVEGQLSGSGAQHNLYATGREPDNTLFGSRIDIRGCRSATNLNIFSPRNTSGDIDGMIYTDADETMAPPTGTDIPLMNKFGQKHLWVVTDIASGFPTDQSFTGQVLEYSTPIPDGKGQYVTVYNNLDNQYGDLSTLTYIPILQLTSRNQTSVAGLCGDTFIAPYSFIKSSYVSDKVGDKFPISQFKYYDLSGKSDRSICDDPEDAVHAFLGKWTHTALPKEFDGADAKNWAGTHTEPGGSTLNWAESVGQAPISDYYYPKVLTHLTTYWGEHRVNPWLREKSEDLDKQWYNSISSKYALDADGAYKAAWEDSYLCQIHVKNTQTSRAKLIIKTILSSLIKVFLPALGLGDLLTPEGVLDLGGGIAESVLTAAILFMMAEVVFNTDFIDSWLGIPRCTTDETGGEEDVPIDGFFMNPSNVSLDFSRVNDLDQGFGLPYEYNTCYNEEYYSPEIYISEPYMYNSHYDGYGYVKPNHVLYFPANNGRLTKLFVLNNRLFGHTTDSIYPILYEFNPENNLVELLLGNSIRYNIQSLFGNIPEGKCGLQYYNASVTSEMGQVFFDAESAKLYVFTGTNIVDLSERGVENFFKEYTSFCEGGCVGQKEVEGIDYVIGIDYRLNRILFTKRDISKDNSWTLSYDYKKNIWVSFHSYIPRAYVWDRNTFFSIDNATEVYEHGNYVTDSYQTYYEQDYPMIIDFVANNNGLPVIYESSVINSEAYSKYGRVNKKEDITFTNVAIFNSYQTSGLLNFDHQVINNNKKIETKEATSIIPIKYANFEWRFNKISDYSLDNNVHNYERTECNPHPKLLNYGDYSQKNIQNYKNKIEKDNFLHTRLMFTNFVDKKLILKSYITRVKSNPETE